MKRVLIFLSVVVLTAILIRVPSTEAKGTCFIKDAILDETNKNSPQISTKELKQILIDKNAFVFDARPFKEYSISHIPGALNLAAKPGVEKAVYVSDAKQVDCIVHGKKEVLIVLYCNGIY